MQSQPVKMAKDIFSSASKILREQLHQPQVPAQYTQVSQVRHEHAKSDGSRRFHNDREGSY